MSTDMDQILEQTQCDYWWLPTDVTPVHRPEITYTHSERPTKLYNAVVRVRSTADQYPGLVAEVQAAHATVPSEWRLATPSSTDALEHELEASGYAFGDECIANTLPVDAPRPTPPAGIEVRHVQTRQELVDQFTVMTQAFPGKTWSVPESELDFHLANSTGPHARTHRFVAYDSTSGQPLCSAAFNSYPKLRFGFLWGGGTIPEARGRGVYSAVMTARIEHARRLSLQHVGLYALTTTSAPIVAAQGFKPHGRVRFWSRPAPGDLDTP